MRPISSFPNLTHLALSLNLEEAAADMLVKDHNVNWYGRCFFRRWRKSEEIAKKCPKLQRIEWLQLEIDSEGNANTHAFVIAGRLEDSEDLRIVKPVLQWWMFKRFYKGSPAMPDVADMVDEGPEWLHTLC
jgi:hypothetical protein